MKIPVVISNFLCFLYFWSFSQYSTRLEVKMYPISCSSPKSALLPIKTTTPSFYSSRETSLRNVVAPETLDTGIPIRLSGSYRLVRLLISAIQHSLTVHRKSPSSHTVSLKKKTSLWVLRTKSHCLTSQISPSLKSRDTNLKS